MRVDAQRGDHVEQRVGVDVFLVRVAAEHELQLRGGDQFADDVLDVVADDALGGGEIADAHADDPALDIADGLVVAPLLDVLAHRDVLRLPVVGLHRAVEIVGPLVLQREQVEGHRRAAVDDPLGGKRGFGLGLIEDEGLGTNLESFLHGREREIERGRSGVFGAAKPVSEPKLLELIDALLTTTGCGPSPQRPQPIGSAGFARQ